MSRVFFYNIKKDADKTAKSQWIAKILQYWGTILLKSLVKYIVAFQGNATSVYKS